MSKKKKIILCIVMLFVILGVSFFGNTRDEKEDKAPKYNYDNADTKEAETGFAANDFYIKPEATTELTETEEDELEKILSNMSVEEKVGQLFFIKNDGRFGPEVLADYPVGGIILFANDFKSHDKTSLTQHILSFQEVSEIPLFIGVDEEGGTVVRLSRYQALADEQFLSPRKVYANGGYEGIYNDAVAKSKLLLSYGINVNFAPVCDVSVNPGEYMYNRSFGENASETAEYVKIVVSAMNEENMGSVLKHFPGYGDNGDTHTYVIYDERPYEQFVNSDFLPFQAGIEVGAQCILVSHNIVKSMDEHWPASLSENVHHILRQELGFEGVIITDDLMMSGVSDYVDAEEAAVRAVQAGNDMILSTNYGEQYEAVLQAVKDGRISEEQINESVIRILRWKYNLGLIDL